MAVGESVGVSSVGVGKEVVLGKIVDAGRAAIWASTWAVTVAGMSGVASGSVPKQAVRKSGMTSRPRNRRILGPPCWFSGEARATAAFPRVDLQGGMRMPALKTWSTHCQKRESQKTAVAIAILPTSGWRVKHLALKRKAGRNGPAFCLTRIQTL